MIFYYNNYVMMHVLCFMIKALSNGLTHFSPVMPYGACQHWFSYQLGVIRQQAIT